MNQVFAQGSQSPIPLPKIAPIPAGPLSQLTDPEFSEIARLVHNECAPQPVERDSPLGLLLDSVRVEAAYRFARGV